ncbi:MAG: hypothetical protein Ct9H90mP23_2870 [Methanobacteriota archaeon]|nr:MAG: hypothetical protein Ct9H90mP23_2870 [Euryarchaeota archaeon]
MITSQRGLSFRPARQIFAIRDAAGLEIEWPKGGEIYRGTVWGSWTDLNENGLRPFRDGSGLGECEDFDKMVDMRGGIHGRPFPTVTSQ